MLALDQSKSPNLALHLALALVATRAKTEANIVETNKFLKNFIKLSP
tara:strand:- start:2391 stop:2531 length:141 start_codon:yes stop_codon:yes gene_type:complete